MAQTGQSTPDIACVRVYLGGVAKYLLDKLYGPAGPPWGTSLSELEDRLGAMQQQLAADFFALALNLQAQQHPHAPAEFHTCPSCQQPLNCPDTQARSTRTGVGLAEWNEPEGYCSRCRRSFFPQSRSLGIDQAELAPSVLRKVISFGTRARSFVEASEALLDGPELAVKPKQIERLIHQVGQERVDERTALVERFERLPLVEKFAVPQGVTAPDLAVVMVDGGRLQIRLPPEQTQPTTPAAPQASANAVPQASANATQASQPPSTVPGDDEDDEERKQTHWREDKVGLLLSMSSAPSDSDPCPEIPPGFLDFERMSKLARQIHHQARKGEEAASEAAEPAAEAETLEEQSVYEPPEVDKKAVLASRVRWPKFAVIVAAAAWALGFQGANRKAFVADGADNNWTVHKRFFGSFVAILDFIHALSYVFAGAMAGREREAGWVVYRRWITWVWSGEVQKVIEELRSRQAELGEPEEKEKETSPRVVVATTLRYLQNNADKMKYAAYRKEGLPITSSLVESTVKQINHRVKGSEKFWTEVGAEAILQLRADQLSAETMDGFWERRQAAASGQRRYRSTKRPSRKCTTVSPCSPSQAGFSFN
jgi:hypothetical protein